MLPNYDYAKRQMDMEIWLMKNLDKMTMEERHLFWDDMGDIMRKEISITELYHKVKDRLEQCDT